MTTTQLSKLDRVGAAAEVLDLGGLASRVAEIASRKRSRGCLPERWRCRR